MRRRLRTEESREAVTLIEAKLFGTDGLKFELKA